MRQHVLAILHTLWGGGPIKGMFFSGGWLES